MRLLVVVLLMLIPLAHGESESSDAAVAHLIDIARGRIDLTNDTALAPGTTREKQAAIRDRIKQLSSAVEEGELRVIDEKVEGGLAAVLVSRIIDYDSSLVQVYAVALLKRDDRWLPAPLLGSYENTGITYIPLLSESAKRLEDWMNRERTAHLTRLRKDVQAELLADIRKAGSTCELYNIEPEQFVERFIDACRQNDIPAALACLGGLEEPLPDNWSETLRFIANSIRTANSPSEAWRRMTNTTCARALLTKETYAKDMIIKIGEFAPFECPPGEPQITVFNFPINRVEGGLWRINLPKWLLDGGHLRHLKDTSAKQIEAFPAKLLAEFPAKDFKTPEELATSLQTTLSGPKFEGLLPYIGIPESGDALEVLDRASRLWRLFHNRKNQAPLLLDVKAEGNQACALFSLFDARNPQINHDLISRVFLEQKGDTWTIPVSHKNALKRAPASLIAWADNASRFSETEWLRKLELAATLDDIPADSTPSEEDALAAANAWLDAIQSRDPRTILQSVAAFDDESGIRKLFKTIGHELQSDQRARITKIHRNGRWAAASTLTVPEQRSEEPYHMLYPIVSTPSGPRILAEAVLFPANTRSREFVNSSIWKRLGDRLPETTVTELKEIQKAHTELAESP
ncbi:hypothetical protein [Haloferula sp.]|uniref:hypothetical protein n=1 Tax=Haloferula sp. TaxID=2497595 RepID=UPI00329C4737